MTQPSLPLKEATSDGACRVPRRLNTIAPLHGPNKVTKPSLYAPTEITTLLPITANAAFQAFVKA